MAQLINGLCNSGPVTLWYVKRGDSFEFNHLENGYVPGNKPVPKFDTQKGWLSSEWKSIYAYLDWRGRVIK